MRRLSSTVMRLRIARPSGTWLMPSATILCGGRRTMLSPSKSIVPAVGRISPEMVFSSVVLPAPLAPISVTIWPCSIVERDVVQHLDLAVAGAQALDRQHAHSCTSSPR